jgi:hypothetical protein
MGLCDSRGSGCTAVWPSTGSDHRILLLLLPGAQFVFKALIYPSGDGYVQLRESAQHLIEETSLQTLAEIKRATVSRIILNVMPVKGDSARMDDAPKSHHRVLE